MDDGNAASEAWRNHELYGSWRVVGAEGFSEHADGNRSPVHSHAQEGVLIFTPGHRMIAFVVHPGRKPASSDAERLQLFKSMVTYSGKFRLDPEKYVLDIDWSSTALNQDEPQIRYYKIDGDTLTITVPLHSNIHDPTIKNSNTLTLVRET